MGETNLGFKVAVALMIIIMAGFMARNMLEQTPSWAIIAAVGTMAACVTFLSPSTGLYLIIIAMMFSPEIPFGAIPGVSSRRAVVRFDDMIIVFVTIAWFIAKVLKHEAKQLHKTPLDYPIGFFIFTCALSTARGVLINQVYPMKGFFYVMKLIEYILIYYMVVNNTHDVRQLRNYIKIFFLVAVAVAVYGYMQIGTIGRVTAPFEHEAEPNTYGGYFVFIFALVYGFVISPVKGFTRSRYLVLVIFIIPPFLYTLSRGSYLAFFPVLLAMSILAPPGKKKLPIVFFLVAVMSVPLLPERVRLRVENTFVGRTTYEVQGFGFNRQEVALDPSSVARLQSWDNVIGYWLEYPILGLGITGAGFIDSQWMRTIGELGIVGIIAVVWLFRHLIGNALRLYRDHYARVDDLGFTLSLGYLGGLVGLIIHAITANTFYIVRIMGPFWFFTALLVMLQKFEVEAREKEKEATEISLQHSIGTIYG